jgi:hypothetical protein
MADSGFDYTEFKNYVENLTKASDKKDFETFLKQFLLEMAQRVVKQAKPKTPVDTGALRNSYVIGSAERFLKKTGGTSKSGKAKVTRDLSKSTVEDIKIVGDIVEVTIGNDMEYASFIEWGSSTKDGKWKNGHFMLTTSIDEIQKQIPKRFEKEFVQYMKNKGVG